MQGSVSHAEAVRPGRAASPLHAVADIVNQQKTIQVNHCRNPACTNYGLRPRTMPGRTGPSAERDPNYRPHSTNRGRVPALLCKSCGEIPPVKSNSGIAAEIARLIETDGLWTVGERTACKNPDCCNVGRSVAHNFIHVGTDGRTPAMRLGLADRPMTYAQMVEAEPRSPRHAPTPLGR